MIASSISGMDAIANLDSPQYKAACWIINDDTRQLDPSNNSSQVALVQRYVLAVLYYSTQGWAWHDTFDFLSEKNECDWNNDYNGYILGVICDEAGIIHKLDLSKFDNIITSCN